MKLIAKRPLDLIVQLSDEEGYSHTELVKKLNMKGPNVTTNIDALVDQAIVYWKDHSKDYIMTFIYVMCMILSNLFSGPI